MIFRKEENAEHFANAYKKWVNETVSLQTEQGIGTFISKDYKVRSIKPELREDGAYWVMVNLYPVHGNLPKVKTVSARHEELSKFLDEVVGEWPRGLYDERLDEPTP